VPSTTRGGKNLPTRKQFSPDVFATTVPKVSSTIIPHSLLSRSSFDDDRTILDLDIAAYRSCKLYRMLNQAIEMLKHGTSTPPSTSSLKSTNVDDLSFTNSFMNPDNDAFDKLDYFEHVPVQDWFSIYKDFCEPAIYIKDDAYNFIVDPEVITMVERDKYYGKEEECPAEHMTRIMSLATALDKDEVKQHYNLLKLFHFSLGSTTRDWYKSLAPRSITSKDECYIVFFSKYFPEDKNLFMMAEVRGEAGLGHMVSQVILLVLVLCCSCSANAGHDMVIRSCIFWEVV
jgi:hypothetical protein